MMGAVVVALAAVVVMLVLGTVVAVFRLLGALRQLRSAVDGTRQTIEPLVAELAEAGQVTDTELSHLQYSIQNLRGGDGGRPTPSPST